MVPGTLGTRTFAGTRGAKDEVGRAVGGKSMKSEVPSSSSGARALPEEILRHSDRPEEARR